MNTAPTRRVRLKRLLIRKIGDLRCRHVDVLVIFRGRMFLRCDCCGRETEGFTVGTRVTKEGRL